MAEDYGFDIRRTAKKKPYLVARFGNTEVKIADFDGEECVTMFLELLYIYRNQEFEKGARHEDNENECTG